MKSVYVACMAALVVVWFATGAARAQPTPTGGASIGPIEDTSYAAGLPDALHRLMNEPNPERWRDYLRQRKLFTMYRIAAGVEAGSGLAPGYLLAIGYADFPAGFDVGILRFAGHTDKTGAEFRLVSFSPGRKETVDALTRMEAQVASALNDALQNPAPRAVPDVPTHPAAEAFVAWSEKPHLALRTRWHHMDGGGDQGSVGLSASILRPLSAGGGSVPSGIEIGANLDYAFMRSRDKSRTGLWDPSYGITVRDQVFRLTSGSPEISRWRWQAGVVAGVRNKANDRVPLVFFVRIRLVSSAQRVYTPLEIAERTVLTTFTARRDGGGKWLYGVQAAWLR